MIDSPMHPAHAAPLRALLLAACLLLFGSPAPAQTADRLVGRWDGAITLPTGELRVSANFTLDGSTLRGTIDIPQQNASGLPLTAPVLSGDSVTFSIGGVPGDPTFHGRFADSVTLVGDFAQGPGRFPFRLQRAEVAAAEAVRALDGVESLIERAMSEFVVPGLAVAVVHRDEVIYSRGFGHRDVANQLPVTPRTQFAIGSSTKAFTTFALGRLVDEGRFDWDAPVRSYIPELRLWDEFATARLTGRDMVTHRSGLPRHDLAWYNARDLTSLQLLERLPHFEPNRQLREAWQYNNIMYALAGHLISRITGQTWDAAVDSLVFRPLGMRESNFSVDAMQRLPDHALPYRERGDTLVRLAFRNIDNVGPAGSINSSVEEMANWLRVHLANGRYDGREIISAASLRDMHTPHMVMPGIPNEAALSPASYGLGWMLATYRGRYRVQHGGNIDGFSALVTLFPRDELGIVVLTNLNGTPLPGLVTNHLADRMLGETARDWIGEAATQRTAARAAQRQASERLAGERQRGTRTAHALAAYAGEYEHPGYGVVRITADRRRLTMTYNDIVTPLEHWNFEVFNGLENVTEPVFQNAKVQFSGDVRGRVDGLQITMDPFVPPIRFGRLADARLRDPAFLATLVGSYTLQGGGQIRLLLRGTRLVAQLPGNQLYTLRPEQDLEFSIEELTGFAVRVELAPDGSVSELLLVQPNGIFRATPVAS
jgi:CubicO group peptidase (beta-lactamase class C family)